ncbi:uncharacterized protein LOC109947216 isoform X5 [Prunus persica]|uniref:uncharacterized protein LOC109947216 isoform X5 n=1 Tax=Prunus persica TaxID=3760 RepID=UPI0009AB654F|nr:uncharacterized protein LOC109947216 isoform X5 [Prunus persica]
MAPVSFERSLKTTILMISPPPADFGSSWRGAFKSCCGRRCLIRHCRRVGRKRGKRKSTATMAIGERKGWEKEEQSCDGGRLTSRRIRRIKRQ